MNDQAAPDSALREPPIRESRRPAVMRILQGPLWLEVLRFGMPLAIAMGLQTTFNLVDAYIISGLEGDLAAAALAAILNCDQIAAVGTILCYGLSVAAGTIISHKHGEGDEEGVRRIAWQSLLLLLALSVVFAAAGIFGSKLLIHDVMQAKGPVAVVGAPYLKIMMGGSFTIFLLLHLVTLQRALGSSKTATTILIVANVANFVLAVLFVYGPGEAPAVLSFGPPIARLLGIPRLELAGAAWATVVARFVALIPAFAVTILRHGLFRKESRRRPDFQTLRRLLNMGWPTSSQLVVRVLAVLAVIRFAQDGFTSETDQSVSTALGIVLRWETMALFVGLGWGSASQTFMGQNMGFGNPTRAHKSGWIMALYNAIMMGLFAALCTFGGSFLISVFSNDPEVIDIGVDYFRWVAPTYVALGTGVVLGSAIQGAGATRLALLLDLIVIFAAQLPLSYAVIVLFDSPTRLWQALAITYLCYALVYVTVYRRGSFLRTRIE
jgi:putative MATE family efflux protein